MAQNETVMSDKLPHWSEVIKTDEKGCLLSGCLCGHFEECDWCSNIDWNASNGMKNTRLPQSWIDADCVVGTDGRYRWLCRRSYAQSNGWKILEIADLLKDKEYRV